MYTDSFLDLWEKNILYTFKKLEQSHSKFYALSFEYEES